MATPRPLRWATAGLCALVLGGGVAGCGSSGLIGNQDAGTVAGLPVRPGQSADGLAWLWNRSGAAVTLESARLLDLRGFTSGRLVHVAVVQRPRHWRSCGLTGGAARGWPPSNIGITRLVGFRLRSSVSRRYCRAAVTVVFAVVADRPGEYADAGVTLTVRKGGSNTTVRVIGPLDFCVTRARHERPCADAFDNRALNASETLKSG